MSSQKGNDDVSWRGTQKIMLTFIFKGRDLKWTMWAEVKEKKSKKKNTCININSILENEFVVGSWIEVLNFGGCTSI
jgi:hypothetical protein